MKKLALLCVIFLIFFSNVPAVYAAFQANSLNRAPFNQRDNYQTDLFTGTASYSYPVAVPKGTNDLTPEVSLSYNSAGSRDLTTQTGVGWELSRDYIQRDINSTATITTDDKFKLHFKGATYDLIYNPTDSMFHTKVETHIKIQQFLSGGQGSTTTYWQVTDTSGTVYRFGYLSASELMCSGQSYENTWNIDQVTDTHNNHIYYTYSQSNGVALLSQIKYNNDQTREVDFNYATNSYSRPVYIQACYTNESSRLSSIQVKVNGSLLREHDMTYTAATSGLPLLQSITEKGSDGSSLPPTTFNYSAEASDWNSTSTKFDNDTNNPLDANIGDTGNPTRVLDVNGDGLPDIVKVSYSGGFDTYRVFKNLGTTWSTTPETWLNNQNIDARPDQYWMRFADVNGDGLPDIVKSSSNGTNATWTVWKNTGTSWNPTPETWVNNAPIDAHFDATANNEVALIDTDGDGLPDINKSIGVSGPYTTWEVFKNTGTGWSTTATNWVTNQYFDARIDHPNSTYMDVNGDGLPDVINSFLDGGPSNHWDVYLNTGSTFVTTAQQWVSGIDANLNNPTVSLADANGDGLPDIIKSNQNGGPKNDWEVWMNNGHGWNSSSVRFDTTSDGPDANLNEGKVALDDAMGNGVVDIIKSTNNGGPRNTWEVFPSNTNAPNLLSDIHNSQGGTTHFDYTPSTKYPNTALPFTMWLVSKMTVNNGMGNSQGTNDVTTYSYKNGYYNWQNKEFRGFGEVDETDPNGSKKQTYFNQDDIFKGKMISVQTTDASGNVYSQKVFNWGSTVANGIATAFLNAEITNTFDGAATNQKVTETDYLYDIYGNVTKKSEMGDINVSGDERFTYNEYTYNPSLWIVATLKHAYLNASNDATKVSESWKYYDGHTGLDDAPTKGDVTKEVSWNDTVGQSNPTTLYTYDTYGNQTQVTDANSHSTTINYGATDTTRTYPDSTTNAKNQTTTTVYDLGTGNLLSKTDPNGNVTTYTYDVFGRILTEVKPYDSNSFPTTTYQYFNDGAAPEGALISKRETSGSAGTLDTYSFTDGLGREIQTRSDAKDTSKQNVTDTFYNPSGQVSQKTVPHADTLSTVYVAPTSGLKNTSFAYDPVDRIVTVTNPDGTTTTNAYDHWVVIKTNERGKTKKEYYNSRGKITKVDEVNNGLAYSTNYAYTPRDELSGITDSAGNSTSMSYDSLGRKKSQTDPDMGTWQYEYDGAGNMTKQTDNRNVAVVQTYDELNRLTKKDYPTDTDTLFSYDGNSKIGTLTSVTDGAGTVNYSYDNRLRKIQEQRTVSSTTKITQFTYDAADRTVSQTNPDGEVITSAYNPQGEVNSVTGVVNNIDYNALGKITKKDFSNGLSTNYTYNTTDFRLNRIQTGALQDLNYTYDPIGNVSTITNTVLSKTQSFGYDDMDRLLTASESAGYNYAYQYNQIGNLTRFTNAGTPIDYTYGQNGKAHALTSSTESSGGGSGGTSLTIFADAMGTGWTDASYNATNTTTTSQVYAGTTAVASTINADGGLDFMAPTGTTTNAYTTVHFAVKASQSNEQFEIYADSVYGQPLGAPVSLASYGGQPISSGWKVYDIPLSALNASNVSLKDIVIHDATSTNQAVIYVDDVKLVGAGSPTSTPTVAPTPTPGPSTIMIFDETADAGWTDASYNVSATISTTQFYQGTKSIAATINADGGLDFQSVTGKSSAGYTSVSFALKASQSNEQFEVYADSTYGQPLTAPVSLANYGGQPTSTGWKVYTIPLSDIGASNITIKDLVIHDATSTNQGVLYVDAVQLVAPTPSPTPSPTPGQGQSGTTYIYDANGNLTSDGTNCYHYNEASQLDKVTKCSNNQSIADYIYDYNGNRMVKKVYTNGTLTFTTTSWSDSYETKVIVGGATENTAYYFVNSELLAKKNPDGSKYYIHNDHLGSASVITNSTGGLVESTTYDPWGEIKSGGTKSKFLYTGQENDPETNQDYYNARYYNPHTRHFTQADDQVSDYYNPQELNRYSYVNNNPIRYTDPTGHWAWVARALTWLAKSPVGKVALRVAPSLPFVAKVANSPVAKQISQKIAPVVNAVQSNPVAMKYINDIDETEAGPRRIKEEYDAVKSVVQYHGNDIRSMRQTVGYYLRDINTQVIKKVGETINPDGRYTQKFLNANNLYLDPQTVGTKAQMLTWQHEEIGNILTESGTFPEMNYQAQTAVNVFR